MRPETKTASDALAWLDAHVNRESLGVPAGASRRKTNPTLDRIAAIVELLGSPQLQYPVLHLTGTNGKTSVARMATALLVGTGLSTGAYTSPHLERVNEQKAFWPMPLATNWCGATPRAPGHQPSLKRLSRYVQER